ncbi:ParA family protein [Streptomyces kaniharaensis]|uniref:ParA family protein n=1 Tax=Streptomyces kaniharaensis TaxID=212423 RepID=A0A6N7L5E7_9ACTN|nr:ParA family protein [Streptomyces kaniharaensis]MQS17948.1 ParA family protein [Streptomyces kaniharaensis]
MSLLLSPGVATRIFVFCNQKGGVGKTSLTAGFAGDLAGRGLRVLVIDLTPQGNITVWLVPAVPVQRTINDVLYHVLKDGASVRDAIVPTSWPGVDLVPSELELASREADRGAALDFRLRRAIRAAELDGEYDVILIDTDPNLGPLLVNALNAAHHAVVVADAERFGADGVAKLLDTIKVVQEEGNPGLDLAGIVVNDYDGRLLEHRGRWKELRNNYPELVAGRLPRCSAVATAASASVPVQSLRGGRTWNLALAQLITDLMKKKAERT